MEPSVSYREYLIKKLRESPEEAALYLNEAMEDEDPRVFLLALRDVAEAMGGLSRVAKLTGLNRENLYRMLSPNGNPAFLGVGKILDATGMRLAVHPKGRGRAFRRAGLAKRFPGRPKVS